MKKKTAAKGPIIGSHAGRYSLKLMTKPTDLDTSELAVLMATTAHLGGLDRLPGFDPTKVKVQITFESGRVGVARLQLGDEN